MILNNNNHYQKRQEQQVAIPKNTETNLIENVVSGVADAVSAIGSLFDIQPSNYDMNEADALRLKKKKKKIKRPRL
jgi:hypothetical protein